MDMTILPPQEATGMPARTEMLRMGNRRSLCMARMPLPHLTRYGVPESPASGSDYGTGCAPSLACLNTRLCACSCTSEFADFAISGKRCCTRHH